MAEYKGIEMNIEGMLAEFNREAEGSGALLRGMLEVIRSGRVPAETDVRQLNASITDLRGRYQEIYTAAEAAVAAEEMPEAGAPAAAYMEAVQNSATAGYRRQLQEMQGVLAMFASVQALTDSYAAALQQYQEDARALADSIAARTIPADAPSVEELEQQVAGPRVFLETLQCADPDSDEALDLLDQVAMHYPRRVQVGLSRQQYVLPAEAVAEQVPVVESAAEQVAVVKASENIEERASAVETVTENVEGQAPVEETVTESAVEQTTAAVETDGEQAAAAESVTEQVHEVETGADQSADTEGSEGIEAPENSGPAMFVQRIVDAGILLEDPSMVGQASYQTVPTEDKKVTASHLKNDLRSIKGMEQTIQLLSQHGIVSAAQLMACTHMPQNIARNALSGMMNKGYLRRYGLKMTGEIYYASPRLIKALTFRDAAKAAGVRQRATEDWGETIDNKATSVAARVVFDRMYCENVKALGSMGLRHSKETCYIQTDSFIMALHYRDNAWKADLNIGAFWDRTEECEAFLEHLADVAQVDEEIRHIRIAAYDLDRARAIAEIILDQVYMRCEQVQLYSLQDDRYYSWPDCALIEEPSAVMRTETEDAVESTICDVPMVETPVAAADTAPAAETAAADGDTTPVADTLAPEEQAPDDVLTVDAVESAACDTSVAEETGIVDIEHVEDENAADNAEDAQTLTMAVPVSDSETTERVADETLPVGDAPENEVDAQEMQVETSAHAMAGDTEPESDAEPALDAAPVLESETVSEQRAATAVPAAARTPRPVRRSVPVARVTTTSDPKTMRANVVELLERNSIYAATAYAKACALQYAAFESFYKRLAYALNDPMEHCYYSTDAVLEMLGQEDGLDGALVLSAAIRTFYSDQQRYDYNLKSYYATIKEYQLLKRYPECSEAMHTLMEFKDAYQTGMDAYADYHSMHLADVEREMSALHLEAEEYYNNYVLGKKSEPVQLKRFVETKKDMFSVDSDLGQYMKAVVTDDKGMQTLALDYLQENFYNAGTTVAEDTISEDRLSAYVDRYWDKAGKLMANRQHEKLMGSRRSNLINLTRKAVTLIVRWCRLIENMGDLPEDAGRTAYTGRRGPLLANIHAAMTAMERDCADETIGVEERAGLRVLIYTLQEIYDCLAGTMVEGEHTYYYVQFLLTDDVMLDEDYLPDLDMHSSTLDALSPMTRILQHAERMQAPALTYEERFEEILGGIDNYGQAELIARYLARDEGDEMLQSRQEDIASGRSYAAQSMEYRVNDFVGSLELAQSYGQIDNSAENKKDQILQIVDEWRVWAEMTSNYGFFCNVMETYLTEIREEAKVRETEIKERLAQFRTTPIAGLSPEAKGRRIARIERMIEEQNYTVAEDLLNRTDDAEELGALIDEDFLREFLDHYDDYYTPVARSNVAFSRLVSDKTRNKEQRGGQKLADSWLPGGTPLGQNRLAVLLNTLGFRDVVITPQDKALGRFEHYMVQTKAVHSAERDVYTHPIAAFGSGAANKGVGFRVVCLNGAYTAQGLIDVMKQIGNAKHTLILLDYALDMGQRRKLARKSKAELGDKCIAVIDRTVMMFLVRNYNETRMNRMLMSLIIPFGYYQPYVWESSNVMPPEIFMGRKHELERIEASDGANIVYGGRQLGKSALLKKAKEDIDGDKYGNRAVIVDIKDKNYREAARKIGFALYDAGILEQEIDTDDWDELARAIKNRLRSDRDYIPYLLLMLDEADAFIDSCGEIGYHPFDCLEDIQGIGTGRFKFVIAGLRNIVRFKKEALSNNRGLTHLETITVRPFRPAEARELLEIPLHYLGFRFTKENEALIALILATTNYFPGLIQLYCAKLIMQMRDKDYAGYDEVNTPVYEVSDSHIKKVLADPEFMNQIREKYYITLRLDEDNYYMLIALLMAYLYHQNGYSSGYTAADIRKTGADLLINKIADLEENRLEAFMDELSELNVLRKTDDKRYLFTRFTFFQMMGTSAEVECELENYMGE